MALTRRQLLAAGVGTASVGALAGCVDGSVSAGADSETTTASSFFVFGSIAAAVAGDAAATELLVPIGQHGHGWEPGPRVREAVADADLLVHGPETFQPWVDDVLADLDADGAEVATVDAASDVALLPAGGGHDDHDGTESGHDHGTADPHFWLDPTRVADAAGTVESALADLDPAHADTYTANADAFRERLRDLDARIEAVVADAGTETLLVAGHDSFGYLEDRYGVHVAALTDVSPDDRPTTRDVRHAQEIVDEHGLRYVVADPLESQQAAEQLVAETDAEAVLPLTAIPGLTDEWEREGWGYVDVMRNVNVPTLERALDA
ncbi:metal ABC transporter substrate-binding protein [Halolamina rubra]|uniref:metal ABC transporter substrate-binding protein n=1 Tax=Halolamina rubra TaxID=1380430 RepID=UPI0006791003|nr:zinc ABC transporter substrate-binding protein [Halolamina rubra]